MFLNKRQLTKLAIVISIACSAPYAAFEGRCTNDQAARNSPLRRQTPEQIMDHVPGVKFKKNLPDNFPVPKYPSNVTKTSFIYTTKGLPAATATIVTSDTAQKVFDWYQQACKAGGWNIKMPTDEALAQNSKHGIYLLNGTRPKEQVSLICRASKKVPGTTISIGWTKTP